MIAPEVLYPRRLAWRALSLVLDQYGLLGVTLKLNPDDPAQALPGVEPGQIDFFEDYDGGRGRAIASVLLEGGRARVLVERVELLVRRNHLRDFRAFEVGIVQRRGLPDIDALVELGELEDREGELMRTAPQRAVEPRLRHRAPTSIRSFGSSR